MGGGNHQINNNTHCLSENRQATIGPKKTGDPISMTRIMCVDDQIFNIEFLRCQLELMPNLQGRCDYADNGHHAVNLVRKTLKNCRS